MSNINCYSCPNTLAKYTWWPLTVSIRTFNFCGECHKNLIKSKYYTLMSEDDLTTVTTTTGIIYKIITIESEDSKNLDLEISYELPILAYTEF